MENLDSSIKKNALNNGLLLGVISFILGLVSFYSLISVSSSWLVIMIPIFFSVIVPIALAVYFSFDLRKKVGGFWTFRQATTGLFIMFIVSFAIQTVATDLIFVKLIEPDMAKKTQDAVIRSTTSMLESAGTPQDQIDEKIEATEKQFESQKNPTIGKRIQGIAISIILAFVLALIFGAFFKRNPPLRYDESVDPDPTV